ncbi:hypothetical protein JOY44_13950 [Phormidium sp. CLA17]|uniref:hypothetical protein n=1 Tax=Leptolyngbya sp. Cla-17 TaxID=2803751 RepID=UPI0014915E9C|nr:hypothetical protein [Leptolyngbya sp. Cla-17]MBM0742697.1 hypothetical protein [Leptolyngbya sp. Cla-17]
MTNFNKPDPRDDINPASVPPQNIDAQNRNIDAQNRLIEQRNSEAAQRDREDSNTFGGLLLGMLLTALVGLGVAAYYFLNQRPSTTNIITPANPVTSPSPQIKERIIERDRIVPVPQQSSAPAPNVNVTIPNPIPQRAPAAPAAPAARPAPAAPAAPAAQPAPEQRVPDAPAPVSPAPAGQ